MTALDRLRDLLAAARQDGVPFPGSWTEAVDAALVGEPRVEQVAWRAALEGTIEAWRAAYYRRPYAGTTTSALALAAA